MRGTFFVNSGFVNQPGHLTWDQLRHMQAAGHEIAGQTIDHARLTRLSPAGIEHEVCDDRGRLLAHGLAVNAFAYPFGAFNRRAERVVMACGYTSARLASGIRGAGKVCVNCPYAESIPPRNPFATRMPAAARKTTKTARMIRAVAHAKATGGGWVQVLIHHICHNCHRYAIAPDALARLLTWLDREPGVQVRTVSQIMDLGGPTIAIRAPRGHWAVGDRMTVPVTFRAPAGVRSIRYFVDGRRIGIETLPPLRFHWFSGGLSPGRHSVRALLEDGHGNAALSAGRDFVRVAPGQTPGR